MADYYLLSKPHCPLCDQAKLLVEQAMQQAVQSPATGWRLHVVDITQQPELLTEYAWLIPVLVRASDDAELRWPFATALEDFLIA